MRKTEIMTRHLKISGSNVEIEAKPKVLVINMTPQHSRYKKITTTILKET